MKARFNRPVEDPGDRADPLARLFAATRPEPQRLAALEARILAALPRPEDEPFFGWAPMGLAFAFSLILGIGLGLLLPPLDTPDPVELALRGAIAAEFELPLP